MTGVGPSMRVFGLGLSRVRFRASRSRLDLTREDPGRCPQNLYIYIYICGFCGHQPGSSLVRSRRDLDVTKRTREDPTPKTRILGPAPSIFLKVDAPETHKQVSLATPKIFVHRVGPKDSKNKKVSLF